MIKQIILGILNLISSIFFLFLFVTFTIVMFSHFNHFPIFTLAQIIIFFISFVVNGTLAYLFLTKENKIKSLNFFDGFTFFPLLWLLLILFGYLISPDLSYFFLTITLCVMIFLILHKVSKRIAISLSLITFFIAMFGIASVFEEDYCKKQAKGQEYYGRKGFIAATPQDAKILKDFDIKPGQDIPFSFRAHLLCHTTFNLGQAIEETYFSK